MPSHNVLLCTLVGMPVEGEHGLAADDGSIDALPHALALARTGRLDDLRRLLLARPDLPAGPLAACGLFVGLTQDLGRGRSLLGLLREIAPLEADVWSALARFEAAVGDEAAALRSAVIHAELMGRVFVTPALEDMTPPGIAPGAIRILRGDVDIDL